MLTACSNSEPEAAIRENIAFMQEAVEAKESGAAVKYLAEHFTGTFGVDKQGLRRMLMAHFMQHRKIGVTITHLEIRVNEYNPITAQMNAVVMLTGAEGLLPRNGELINVSGDWELYDDEWLLVRAKWE